MKKKTLLIFTLIAVCLACCTLVLKPQRVSVLRILPRKVWVAPHCAYDGIDVSHHQGTLDWERIGRDSHVQFAYIKATEGATWRDSHFANNVSEAQKHGVKVGAYHLLSLTSSPEAQVENFCRMVGAQHLDLIPALDIESMLMKHKNSKRLKNYVIRVDELLTKRFGRKPLIYTSSGLFNRYLSSEFADHYLWIGGYLGPCPQLKDGALVHIWQYTEKGKISSYDKTLDLNCFVNGMTVEKLKL